LIRFSLFQGDEYKAARLGAYVSGDMALTGSVVCQKNIARTEAPFGAIADFYLRFTGQVDDILAPRCPMPAVNVIRSSVTENDTIPRLEFFGLHFDFIEMRLAVRSGVKSGDFHGSALIENSALKDKIIFFNGLNN
jgi:hypothetical protein